MEPAGAGLRAPARQVRKPRGKEGSARVERALVPAEPQEVRAAAGWLAAAQAVPALVSGVKLQKMRMARAVRR